MVLRLLDLFCGAGGAGAGYHRVGFEIVGVDIEPQPNYPFEFVQMDALDALCHPWAGWFSAFHASPPCDHYSQGAKQSKVHVHPALIRETRDALRRLGRPYVIENIAAARDRLIAPVRLCGTQFGLGVFRHRLFEINGFKIGRLPHPPHDGRVGDGRYFTVAGHPGGSSARDGWHGGSAQEWNRAMDIDWMTTRELADAVPPAYTEHIGKHLFEALR